MEESSAKYNRIGIDYNSTRNADPFLTSRMAFHLQLADDKTYLDIGCGTGNYTKALHRQNGKFIGIDPSEVMLAKAAEESSDIIWKRGTAENTGLEDESVSGILAGLTIHHWPDLKAGFMEMYRVLKPRSRMVVFTSSPAQMHGYWLNHYFLGIIQAAIKQMPKEADVKLAMEEAGFQISNTEKYFVQKDLEDLFLYCGKHDPELYFNSQIMKGISSFSDLAKKEEVETGLIKLRADIDEGRVQEVMASYENLKGDYLFISAIKFQ